MFSAILLKHLGNILLNYYQNLFLENHDSNTHDYDLDFEVPKLSPTHIDSLCAPLSELEVELVVKDLAS